MKKEDVRTGATYLAKVSGEVVPVTIKEEKWRDDRHTGWVGTNTQTGRSVYIKSAQRLRAQVGEAKAARIEAPAAPDAGDVGDGAAIAGGGEARAKAASPVPPKATSGGKGKKGAKATRGQKAAKPVKAPKAAKPKAPKKDRPMSGLDAAAKVLADAGEPMRVKDIVAASEKKGLWKSKAGKTPEATVYAAIIREIFNKGVDSRFVKKDRGLFAAAGKGR